MAARSNRTVGFREEQRAIAELRSRRLETEREGKEKSAPGPSVDESARPDDASHRERRSRRTRMTIDVSTNHKSMLELFEAKDELTAAAEQQEVTVPFEMFVSVQERLDFYQRKCDELNATNNQLIKGLADSKKEVESANKRVKSLTENVSSLSARIDQLLLLNADLRRERDLKQEELQQSEEEKAILVDKRQQQHDALNVALQKIEELKVTVMVKEKGIEQLMQTRLKVQEDNKGLQRKLTVALKAQARVMVRAGSSVPKLGVGDRTALLQAGDDSETPMTIDLDPGEFPDVESTTSSPRHPGIDGKASFSGDKSQASFAGGLPVAKAVAMRTRIRELESELDHYRTLAEITAESKRTAVRSIVERLEATEAHSFELEDELSQAMYTMSDAGLAVASAFNAERQTQLFRDSKQSKLAKAEGKLAQLPPRVLTGGPFDESSVFKPLWSPFFDGCIASHKAMSHVIDTIDRFELHIAESKTLAEFRERWTAFVQPWRADCIGQMNKGVESIVSVFEQMVKTERTASQRIIRAVRQDEEVRKVNVRSFGQQCSLEPAPTPQEPASPSPPRDSGRGGSLSPNYASSFRRPRQAVPTTSTEAQTDPITILTPRAAASPSARGLAASPSFTGTARSPAALPLPPSGSASFGATATTTSVALPAPPQQQAKQPAADAAPAAPSSMNTATGAPTAGSPVESVASPNPESIAPVSVGADPLSADTAAPKKKRKSKKSQSSGSPDATSGTKPRRRKPKPTASFNAGVAESTSLAPSASTVSRSRSSKPKSHDAPSATAVPAKTRRSSITPKPRSRSNSVSKPPVAPRSSSRRASVSRTPADETQIAATQPNATVTNGGATDRRRSGASAERKSPTPPPQSQTVASAETAKEIEAAKAAAQRAEAERAAAAAQARVDRDRLTAERERLESELGALRSAKDARIAELEAAAAQAAEASDARASTKDAAARAERERLEEELTALRTAQAEAEAALAQRQAEAKQATEAAAKLAAEQEERAAKESKADMVVASGEEEDGEEDAGDDDADAVSSEYTSEEDDEESDESDDDDEEEPAIVPPSDSRPAPLSDQVIAADAQQQQHQPFDTTEDIDYSQFEVQEVGGVPAGYEPPTATDDAPIASAAGEPARDLASGQRKTRPSMSRERVSSSRATLEMSEEELMAFRPDAASGGSRATGRGGGGAQPRPAVSTVETGVPPRTPVETATIACQTASVFVAADVDEARTIIGYVPTQVEPVRRPPQRNVGLQVAGPVPPSPNPLTAPRLTPMPTTPVPAHGKQSAATSGLTSLGQPLATPPLHGAAAESASNRHVSTAASATETPPAPLAAALNTAELDVLQNVEQPAEDETAAADDGIEIEVIVHSVPTPTQADDGTMSTAVRVDHNVPRGETPDWMFNTLVPPSYLRDQDDALFTYLPAKWFEFHNVLHRFIAEVRKKLKIITPLADPAAYVGDGADRTIADVHCALRFDIEALDALTEMWRGQRSKAAKNVGVEKARRYRQRVADLRLHQLDTQIATAAAFKRLPIADRNELQQYRHERAREAERLIQRQTSPRTIGTPIESQLSLTSALGGSDHEAAPPPPPSVPSAPGAQPETPLVSINHMRQQQAMSRATGEELRSHHQPPQFNATDGPSSEVVFAKDALHVRLPSSGGRRSRTSSSLPGSRQPSRQPSPTPGQQQGDAAAPASPLLSQITAQASSSRRERMVQFTQQRDEGSRKTSPVQAAPMGRFPSVVAGSHPRDRRQSDGRGMLAAAAELSVGNARRGSNARRLTFDSAVTDARRRASMSHAGPPAPPPEPRSARLPSINGPGARAPVQPTASGSARYGGSAALGSSLMSVRAVGAMSSPRS